jgi:RND superfamily putative drug exporter
MFEGLGSRTYRYRYLIVAAWLAAAVLSLRFAPSIASQGSADQASFLPSSVPSVVAQKAIDRAFPGSTSTSSATVTFSRDAGLTDADRAYLYGFSWWVRSTSASPTLQAAVTSVDSATTRPELATMLRSSDGKLELLNVNLNVSSAGDQAEAVVSDLRARAEATAPSGLAVHVTGSAGITTDYLKAIKAGTDSTTMVTVVLVLIILLLIYRAPLAALVPLATIGGAFLVARGVLGALAAAGWQISSLLDTFTVVLVFGVGTDYTIFLISRYREEVREGDWHDASRRTVRRIGAVISASAATVIVGLGAMAFGDFEMIRSTGPALAVAIFVTLVAGLTLAPALLGIFGHYLFWPLHARTGSGEEPGGFFARLADVVMRHPGTVTVAIVLALLVPASFLPQMKTNFDTLAELPASSDARAGFDEVAAHLGKGKLVQSTGLVDVGGQGDILSPASLARLRDTMTELSGTAGVGSVTSLVTPKGDGKVPDGLRPSSQLATMADSFSGASTGSTDSSAGSTSVVDPKVASGLSDALDYLGALGVAFPDVAARSEYRAATAAVADAQSIVERAKEQSVVSTQLRTLASALTSPTAVAAGDSGGSSDSGLVKAYLDELAAAYPETRALAAFKDATRAAVGLERKATASGAIEAADALERLAVHFDPKPAATLSATSLAGTPSARQAKREATATFARIPGTVRSLSSLFVGRSDDIFIPVGLAGADADALKQAVDAFVSRDRTATRFYVTAVGDPYSTPAFTMIRTVQDELAAAATSFGTGASAALDGPTAQLSDVQTVLERDFQRVGVVTVLGILIVLILLLRAIVAPLYLVATVLLSYASAVGLSAWLFQGPLGQPGVSFYLPLLVFVLLVALGSDYNIFLMSRVREESETRPIRDGIRVASGHTGAVITSAGLILAGTFGSMATAPLAVLFQIGVAVAIGVLIDTFVVRSILVPAITTLVGDRAWWPAGARIGGWLAPAPLAAGSAVLASTDDRPRRSPLRVAAAIVLALLVPVTFAGLIVWARPATGSPAVQAAVVNLDEGATTAAADGSARTLHLGAELAAALESGRPSNAVTWTAADAASAASGLADGTYDAVLTIPAGYSGSVAARQVARAGAQPGPTLQLETSDGSGAATEAIARDLSLAVSAAATRDAMVSYVGDLLLAVSTTYDRLSGAATTAHGIADRTSSLASDASGIGSVSGELVSGLGALASGTAGAADGAAKLASGTRALASGAKQLAGGAASLAGGAAQAATGAARLSSGAASLADGLSRLDAETSALPAQVQALDSGASALAGGAASAATGAAQLSDGLAALSINTSGLGDQTAALDAGVGRMLFGAQQLQTGATQAAAGATSLATTAGQLDAAVQGYTASVADLAGKCLELSGGTAVCGALSQIVGSDDPLLLLSGGVKTGVTQMAGATQGISTGVNGLTTGITTLREGTSALASAAPQLGSAIAQATSGASSLSGGISSLSDGASKLADGTHRFAAGMPALADGISSLSTGASQLAAGAATLSAGASGLASGAAGIASGAHETADGTASLASATAASASGVDRLSAALSQAVDGAKVVRAQTGRLATDGRTLARDASGAAASLDSAKDAAPSYPDAWQGTLAAQVATPVSIEGALASGGAPTGLAPYVVALALWLGALAALVVLPSGRRRLARPTWARPLRAFGATAALSLAAAALMVAGLLVAGLSVARLPEMLVVCAVAAVAFVAIVQALVVAFGRRGWLVGMLFAGIQVAASGLLYPVDALPGPLAFLHPLLPLTWASDALATCIGGGTAEIGPQVAVLAACSLGALLVILLVTARPGGPETTAGLGATAQPDAAGTATA